MEEYDIVVVGGGLGGLTAGLFGARCGRSTLVLVPDLPGGHLANIERVEDFPGFDGIAGFELGPKLQEQAASAGANLRAAEAHGFDASGGDWCVATSGGDISARSLILATGSHPRKLGVPGEERREGQGVSHCASCDGPLLRGGPAVVIGGGDSAFQEALALASYGSEVTIVHRGPACPAQQVYQRRARDDARITVRDTTHVLELVGEDILDGVRVRYESSGLEAVLPAAGVWIYVGLEPNTAMLQSKLALDETGHVPTDVWLRTQLRGVFAAGDVRSDSAGQAISAAGDGATAAIAAHRYLDNGAWPITSS